jgi:hypothetical protein
LSGAESSAAGAEPKYLRPKILVIDAPEVTPVLEQLGYAAVSGSFGQPVLVPAGAGYLPLSLTADGLPGYTEQEIVVADLAGPAPQEYGGKSVELPGPGVEMVWAPTATGLVDPRPAVMLCVRDAMDRIYQHGGVFIIFGVGRYEPRCIISTVDRFGSVGAHGARPLGAHNWSLLSELRWIPDPPLHASPLHHQRAPARWSYERGRPA